MNMLQVRMYDRLYIVIPIARRTTPRRKSLHIHTYLQSQPASILAIHLFTRAPLLFFHLDVFGALDRGVFQMRIFKTTNSRGKLPTSIELDPWAKSHRYLIQTNDGRMRSWNISTRRTNTIDLYHELRWKTKRRSMRRRTIQSLRTALVVYFDTEL